MKKDPTFPDRLQRLMDKQSLTRADLARRVWGTIVDERGYEVAKGRQLVGKYLSGGTVPSENTKKKLATALNVSFQEIDPKSLASDRPGSGITLTPVGNTQSRLDLSIVLPIEVAGDIIQRLAPYAK